MGSTTLIFGFFEILNSTKPASLLRERLGEGEQPLQAGQLDPGNPSSQTSRRLLPLVLVAALLALVIITVPLLTVTYPPLQDLPNHLARIIVLTAKRHAILSFYEVDWQVIPNLLTDVIFIGLDKVMSLATASKVSVFGSAALWLIAPFLLHWAVYKRVSMLPLVGALFCMNRVLEMGFMNFFLGSSLVVICFAVWIMAENQRFTVRTLLGMILATLLFFCHLFVFGVFGICILVWEAFRHGSTPLWRRLALPLLAGLPGLIGLLVGPHERLKTRGLFSYDGNSLMDIAAGKLEDVQQFLISGVTESSATVAILAVLLIAALITARQQLDRRLGVLCALMLALFVVLPFRIFDGAHVDWRMLAPFSLLMAAWLRIEFTRLQSTAFAAVVLLSLGGQTFVVLQLWHGAEELFQQYRTIDEDIPRGSKVVHAIAGITKLAEPNLESTIHYAGISVIERGAMVPSLFAFPTQQPIGVRRRYGHINRTLGNLVRSDSQDLPWPVFKNFDYVVLETVKPFDLPEGFTEVASTAIFHLLKVTPENTDAPPPAPPQ